MANKNGCSIEASEWRQSGKGCLAMTLSGGGFTVRVTQRAPGGPFYRVVSMGAGRGDPKSLQTRDAGAARGLAVQFLRELMASTQVAASAAKPQEVQHSGFRVAGDPSAPPTGLTVRELWSQFQASAQFRRTSKKFQADSRCRASILLAGLPADAKTDIVVEEIDDDALMGYEIRREEGGIEYDMVYMAKGGRPLPPRRKTTEPVSARSIQADLKLLRMMILWAFKKKTRGGGRLLTEDPMRGYAIKPERNPTRLAATETRYQATLVALSKMAEESVSEEHRLEIEQAAVALKMLNGTGRRSGAVLDLHWSDLLLGRSPAVEEPWITFRADADKQGITATVPLDGGAAATLREWRSRCPSTERVFPNRAGSGRMRTDRLAVLIRAAEMRAQMEPLRQTLLHAYRRKFATERGHLQNLDVMELMGLKDAKVFASCYRRSPTSELRKALKDARPFTAADLGQAA